MKIVVTGATGNVGRPLVTELVAAGVQVRAVSRSPDAANLPAGVEVFPSVSAALPGAAALFVNSRALGDGLHAAVTEAVSAGVTRVVALSAINADDDFSRQPSRFRGDRNKEAEQAVVESELAWVSLRPSVFASNFAGMWSAQLRAGDVVVGPYASASTAPIADSDISAVAARALLTDDLIGQQIPLTGPQALTNAELVGAIGAVLRRPLRYQEAPAQVVRQQFVTNGFSPEFADAYLTMLAQTLDTSALVTHDVEKILGRPPLTFSEWVARNPGRFNAFNVKETRGV